MPALLEAAAAHDRHARAPPAIGIYVATGRVMSIEWRPADSDDGHVINASPEIKRAEAPACRHVEEMASSIARNGEHALNISFEITTPLLANEFRESSRRVDG